MLVDEDAEREGLVRYVVAARGCSNLQRIVLEHAAEREVFERRDLAAKQANVRHIERNRRDAVDGARQVVSEDDVGLVLVELLAPS